MNFCPKCASTLQLKHIDGVERKACVAPECGFVQWDNPVPVVAALVERVAWVERFFAKSGIHSIRN